MRRVIIKYVRKVLSVTVSTFTTLGMFLIGTFIRNLGSDKPLTTEIMIIIALVSIILTYLLTNLTMDITLMYLEMVGQEEIEREAMFEPSRKVPTEEEIKQAVEDMVQKQEEKKA